jgi:tetratricopeptide (TPR) repeat protein
VLALWPASAGAQEKSPEQAIDEYVGTGDSRLLAEATALVRTLPKGPRSRLLHARLLLLSGETRDALREAAELNRELPDELDPYALMVEASLLLGDVPGAEKSGQWMLNLRPEDPRSLLAGAAVREALEDYSGAETMLVDALARIPRSDAARRASIGVSMARLRLRRGQVREALALLDKVEAGVPGYRPATLLRRQMEGMQ